MSISQAVLHLCQRLKTKAPDDANFHLFLGAVETFPRFLEARDLGEWENQCQDILPEEDTFVEQAADPFWLLAYEIFELGRHNLYGAFQAESTRLEYVKICASFLRQDILTKSATEFDLTKWG